MIKLNAFASHEDTDQTIITPIVINPSFVKMITPYYEPEEEGEPVNMNAKPYGSVIVLDGEETIRVKEDVERVYDIIQETANPLGL